MGSASRPPLGPATSPTAPGLLFLTRWKSRTAPARRDLFGPTGQTRLSYRTAAAEFRKHSGGQTLRQLRNSSLTYLAEAGASAVMLQGEEPAPGFTYLVVLHPPRGLKPWPSRLDTPVR